MVPGVTVVCPSLRSGGLGRWVCEGYPETWVCLALHGDESLHSSLLRGTNLLRLLTKI